MTSREQIRSFISDTFFVDEFADGDSFLKNGIIDSMGMLELVVFLEKTFGIAIVDVELVPENLDSVDNLAGFIERKRAVAA
ncbi:MAG: acyl carrier protein [Nevskia sp.]|nr:acyl carrier protein [Nevskia sp.]